MEPRRIDRAPKRRSKVKEGRRDAFAAEDVTAFIFELFLIFGAAHGRYDWREVGGGTRRQESPSPTTVKLES